MLLIQAIRFLINKIDTHLASELNCAKADVDQELAKVIKKETTRPTRSVSSAQTSQSVVRAAPAVQVNEEASKPFDLAWAMLPEAISFSHFPVPAPEGRLNIAGDNGPLTWLEFMRQPHIRFSEHLVNNELKEKDYTYLKRVTLAWYKHQLIFFSLYAERVLEEREKGAIHSPIRFDDGVDKWLLKMLTNSFKAATKLLNDLRLAEGRKRASMLPNYGDTDIVLSTCDFVLKNFGKFCQDADKVRNKSKSSYGSMQDVYKGTMREDKPLTFANQKIAEYLLDNLDEEGFYDSYQLLNLTLPLSWRLYNPEVAQKKRGAILEKIHTLDDAHAHAMDTKEYWSSILEVPHVLATAAAAYQPLFSWHQQRFNKMCQDMHDTLKSRAHTFDASKVALEHKCSF